MEENGWIQKIDKKYSIFFTKKYGLENNVVEMKFYFYEMYNQNSIFSLTIESNYASSVIKNINMDRLKDILSQIDNNLIYFFLPPPSNYEVQIFFFPFYAQAYNSVEGFADSIPIDLNQLSLEDATKWFHNFINEMLYEYEWDKIMAEREDEARGFY